MRGLSAQIQWTFNRSAHDRAMAAELEAHVEMHVTDNVRRGMDPATARRDALMHLGGIPQTIERCRDVGSVRWLSRLLHQR